MVFLTTHMSHPCRDIDQLCSLPQCIGRHPRRLCSLRVLFARKGNGLRHVAEPVDDQVQRLLRLARFAVQVYQLGYVPVRLTFLRRLGFPLANMYRGS